MCKIKHLQNVVKCFILHVSTAYLQRVFNVLKHLQKCFATFQSITTTTAAAAAAAATTTTTTTTTTTFGFGLDDLNPLV